MRLPSQILIPRRRFPLFGIPPPKCHHHHHATSNVFLFNLNQTSQFHAYPFRFLGSQPVSSNTQKFSFLPSSGVSLSGALPVRIFESLVAPTVRYLSTSVEIRVNENNFEKIYVQNGINVKPPVVERIDKVEGIAGEKDSRIEVLSDDNVVNKEDVEGINGVSVMMMQRNIG